MSIPPIRPTVVYTILLCVSIFVRTIGVDDGHDGAYGSPSLPCGDDGGATTEDWKPGPFREGRAEEGLEVRQLQLGTLMFGLPCETDGRAGEARQAMMGTFLLLRRERDFNVRTHTIHTRSATGYIHSYLSVVVFCRCCNTAHVACRGVIRRGPKTLAACLSCHIKNGRERRENGPTGTDDKQELASGDTKKAGKPNRDRTLESPDRRRCPAFAQRSRHQPRGVGEDQPGWAFCFAASGAWGAGE